MWEKLKAIGKGVAFLAAVATVIGFIAEFIVEPPLVVVIEREAEMVDGPNEIDTPPFMDANDTETVREWRENLAQSAHVRFSIRFTFNNNTAIATHPTQLAPLDVDQATLTADGDWYCGLWGQDFEAITVLPNESAIFSCQTAWFPQGEIADNLTQAWDNACFVAVGLATDNYDTRRAVARYYDPINEGAADCGLLHRNFFLQRSVGELLFQFIQWLRELTLPPLEGG